jgi:hypothetical protein
VAGERAGEELDRAALLLVALAVGLDADERVRPVARQLRVPVHGGGRRVAARNLWLARSDRRIDALGRGARRRRRGGELADDQLAKEGSRAWLVLGLLGRWLSRFPLQWWLPSAPGTALLARLLVAVASPATSCWPTRCTSAIRCSCSASCRTVAAGAQPGAARRSPEPA